MGRFGLAIFCLFAAVLATPPAEACSCICDRLGQPDNAAERRAQVRKTISTYDLIFIGEVVAIDEPEAPAANASPFVAVTIKPAKILKGEPADFITVMARAGDGVNCFNEVSLGGHFRGLAKRVDGTWRADNLNCNCHHWAIFYRDGPLADAKFRTAPSTSCAN